MDSTAAIAAERQGKNPRQLLEAVAFDTGEDDIALSVISLLELAHGLSRANTVARRQMCQRFLDELMSSLPVHPITAEIALHAGRIDGQSQAKGIRIPLSDLLIGATALRLGYRVGTHNFRHFGMIPGLDVVQF